MTADDPAVAVMRHALVRNVGRASRPVHSCGTCTLCCTVMRVEMDPPKPAYETCQHCSSGCAIYATRPDPCVGFQCLWLASQQSEQLAMIEDLRPDRCGVAIDLNAAGTIMAHCLRSDSWRSEPMRSWLLRLAAETSVILELPDGAELLAPDGTTEKLVKIGVHASGNRLYARASDLRPSEKEVAA